MWLLVRLVSNPPGFWVRIGYINSVMLMSKVSKMFFILSTMISACVCILLSSHDDQKVYRVLIFKNM